MQVPRRGARLVAGAAGMAGIGLVAGLLPLAPASAAPGAGEPIGASTSTGDSLMAGSALDAAVAGAVAGGARLVDEPTGRVAAQVVALDAASGEVARLATGSPSAAAELAADLDARTGVVAAVNRTYTLTGSIKADRVLLPPTSSVVAPAEHDPTLEPRFARQWGLSWLGLPGAWAASTGTGVTVAVLDTGVDATHPDLDARVLPGFDLVGGGDGRVDPNGHGTFVAGIVGAALDGVGVVGAAEDASLLPVRVLDAAGSGDTGTVAAGVRAAVSAGAGVINMSLGGEGADPVLGAAVSAARAAGAVVVAAVGNEFLEGNPVEYPAGFPGVLGVTAFAPDGTSAAFANTGATVDLAAPGVDVWSDLPQGKIGAGDGTSFAAPHVAAVAALVRSAAPGLTGDAVADVLLATAQDDTAADGRDDVFGAGLVRADLALAAVGAALGAGSGAGEGLPDGSTADAPAALPGALPAVPASVRARLRGGTLVMRWATVPGATGYVAALRVKVPSDRAASAAGSARWSRWWRDPVGADVVGGSWTRVRGAVAYQVRVAAVTDAGRGSWSRAVTVRSR